MWKWQLRQRSRCSMSCTQIVWHSQSQAECSSVIQLVLSRSGMSLWDTVTWSPRIISRLCQRSSKVMRLMKLEFTQSIPINFMCTQEITVSDLWSMRAREVPVYANDSSVQFARSLLLDQMSHPMASTWCRDQRMANLEFGMHLLNNSLDLHRMSARLWTWLLMWGGTHDTICLLCRVSVSTSQF